MTILLPLVGFLFISLLVYAGAMALAPSGGDRHRSAGSARSRRRASIAERRAAVRPYGLAALKRMGAMAPRSTKELGKLQQRLVIAGYRSREALVVFFGIRLGLAVALLRGRSDADVRPSESDAGARRLRRRLRAAQHGRWRAWPKHGSTGCG